MGRTMNHTSSTESIGLVALLNNGSNGISDEFYARITTQMQGGYVGRFHLNQKVLPVVAGLAIPTYQLDGDHIREYSKSLFGEEFVKLSERVEHHKLLLEFSGKLKGGGKIEPVGRPLEKSILDKLLDMYGKEEVFNPAFIVRYEPLRI